jgi:hypothetical protein
MELNNGFCGCDASVGDYVLAGVIAFCRTIPKEGSMEESWGVSREVDRRGGIRIVVAWPSAQFSCLQTCER